MKVLSVLLLVCIALVNADNDYYSEVKNEFDDTLNKGEHFIDDISDVIDCSTRSGSCEECVKESKCLWCDTSLVVKCIRYPEGQVIPSSDVCGLSDAKWGVCWVNYEILLIGMGVLAGVIILSIIGCICCCCCRRKTHINNTVRVQAQFDRQAEDRFAHQAERTVERQARADDIRHKYGLINQQKGGYTRFENEA